MSLTQYLNDLKKLESTLEDEIKKIIKDNEGYIVGLVKNRLFNKGVDIFGKQITPTYTKQTIESKKEKKQRSSFVTLRDKGSFYNGIFAVLENWVLIIDSTDPKTPSLIEKYGPVLGLTKEEQEVLIQSIIEPRLQKLLDKISPSKINLLE